MGNGGMENGKIRNRNINKPKNNNNKRPSKEREKGGYQKRI